MIRIRSWKSRLSIAGAVLTLAVVAPTSTPASADDGQNNQCLVTVAGKATDGTFTIGSTRCFATLAEVFRAAGAQNVSDAVTPLTARLSGIFGITSIIGIHYDSSNGTGASYTVNGSNCSGGGLNVSLAWNDKISSTINGCPSVIHYETTNYGGATKTTFGVGALSPVSGYMDNKTSSIKYF